jgi:RimJ/RimL family protein N-acetyltransferase
MAYGRDILGFEQVLAIVTPDNHASHRLLEKLRFRFTEQIIGDAGSEKLNLYASP